MKIGTHFRKVLLKISVVLAVCLCLFFVDNVWNRNLFSNKSLVVYFSSFGNTKAIAKDIQEKLGADILRLQTVVKYPKDKALFLAQMKAEISAQNYYPALINGRIDLSPYDVIVIGTPVWKGRAAPAVISFLKKNNFAGKRVYFFSTYSRNAGLAISEMKKACPNATCGSFLKVELTAPLNNDEASITIPGDIIKKWTTEIMAKQK